MKKVCLVALMAATFSASSAADTLGLYIGGQVWDAKVDGILGESGNQTDFNLSDEKQTNYYVAFEHPIPLIPNARIASTTLETTGMTTLASDIDFGGETFAAGSDVNTGFDVSYIDYTLYYEIFDNGLFSFDIGLTGRDFNGDVMVSTTMNTAPVGETPQLTTVTGTINTDEIVPMVYVATSIGLPLTGLSVFGEGNLFAFGDHTLHDYQVGLSYDLVNNIAVDFNVTLGYRSVQMDLQDLEGLYSNLDFDGVFAGAVLHF